MPSRIGAAGALPDDKVRSQARGAIEVVQQLAGKARVLYELACGESAVSGEHAIAGTNPQGEVGCDLSGPPWGSAPLHPIAWWSWLADDADVTQPDQDLKASFISGVTIPAVLRWSVWVRPHEPNLPGAIAPYSRAQIWVRGHRTAGGGAATLLGRARNLTREQDAQTERTASSASTSSTTETDLFSSSSFFVDLNPGWNNLVLAFFCETAEHAIQIDNVGLLQTAKRSH